MAAKTTVPVTIKPDAEVYVAGLGMRRELTEMLDQAKHVVPYLRSLRVTLEPDPEGSVGPGIVIWAHRADTDWENDRSDQDFGRWMVTTYPPEVCLQFSLLTVYNDESDYEG